MFATTDAVGTQQNIYFPVYFNQNLRNRILPLLKHRHHNFWDKWSNIMWYQTLTSEWSIWDNFESCQKLSAQFLVRTKIPIELREATVTIPAYS